MTEWISVKDRLPAFDITVLVIGESGIALAKYGDFEDCWDGKYSWSAESYGHDGCDGKFEPTHWMPLPKPPKDYK